MSEYEFSGLPGAGVDHLTEAQDYLDRAALNVSKIVGPSIEVLVSLATANALVALAESIEAIAFDDVPLYPVDPPVDPPLGG